MKLVVISPEYDDPREVAVLGKLFAAGLERYHVRKPHVKREGLAAWLRAVPAESRRRIVLHQHHELAAELGCGGRHWRDDGLAPAAPRRGEGIVSRACHDLATLRAAAGCYDAVLFAPVFDSLSKPGRGPDQRALTEISSWLRHRTGDERRTQVLALGGITADTAPRAMALGFDGVAALGAIWRASDPVEAFRAIAGPNGRAGHPSLTRHPIMCLTQDGLALSHVEQARRLCAGGARWIQLRMKNAAPDEWRRTAAEVVAICRAHEAICIVNDNVDLALVVGADGAHLGKLDLDWAEARRRLGPGAILGGTVNNAEDAGRARASGALDYVGLGPLRFTTTKERLAPVLGLAGIRQLIGQLGDLPAWAIGGVTASDLPELAAVGAAGAAISGALFRDDAVEHNFRTLAAAWTAESTPVLSA